MESQGLVADFLGADVQHVRSWINPQFEFQNLARETGRNLLHSLGRGRLQGSHAASDRQSVVLLDAGGMKRQQVDLAYAKLARSGRTLFEILVIVVDARNDGNAHDDRARSDARIARLSRIDELLTPMYRLCRVSSISLRSNSNRSAKGMTRRRTAEGA